MYNFGLMKQVKQVLLNYPSFVEASAKDEQSESVALSLLNVVIISPCGCIYPVFFEVDDGGYSTRRDEIDPDDLTDYGYWYWRRNRSKKSSHGYGDDN